MSKKILIVEDQFIEANHIQLILKKAGYIVCGIARSADVALEMITDERPDFVLVDIFLKGKRTGIDLAIDLKERNIPFIYISANSNEEILAMAKTTEPYGFIVKPFREKDLMVTLEIAQYRFDHSVESKYRRETELVQELGKITKNEGTVREKILALMIQLQQHVPFDCATIGFEDINTTSTQAYSFLRIGFNEYQVAGVQELLTMTRLNIEGLASLQSPLAEQTVYINGKDFVNSIQQPCFKRLFHTMYDMTSCIEWPLALQQRPLLGICFYSRRSDVYTASHVDLLNRLQQTVSSALEKILFPNAGNTPAKPAAKAIQATGSFDGVIGNSYKMLRVFDKITQVAPYDTSILILGESGTGKERIADHIYRQSARKDKAIVKINCAALPPTLIESELFGHEKGAFTGATDKRAGKFLQAHEGTIFLDEIGEMPLDLQTKLLRVLQEKEIEPLGGKSTIKVDVRIIAATNRNLEKEVAEGRFRLDLYYRLNVFPIQLPPLRERKEDIHSLALHFISVYNSKANKRIEGLSDKALNKLYTHLWPGNIRELENLIERSVLQSRGNIIEDVELLDNVSTDILKAENTNQVKTIDEIERDHILSVLQKVNGKISGPGGAAELLSIPPTTLTSKMKKLGIEKGFHVK